MKKYENNKEYLLIIKDIIENDEFKKISNIKHHNTTRLDHCMKVSYYSYLVAKSLNLDYKDVARGGLLHDFYIDKISDCDKLKDKLLLFSIKHPNDAVNNASSNFELTDKQINIIESHMFPVDYKLPKYAESWIVSTVDKVLSFSEFSKKFSYKLTYIANLYLLFILNIIK